MNVNLSKFVSILNKQQSSILQAAMVIMLSVFGSRILGLLKYRLLAAHFGQSIDVLDSYIAASQIPEAIFEIIIFGAVSIAFIPIFSRYINSKNYQEGWKLASSMISLGLISYLVLAVIFFIFADFLALIFAPGITADNSALRSQVANLMRVMLFAQIFFVFSTFLTGVLQTFQRFLIPATAAMVYNIGIIFGIIFLSPSLGIYGPAWGMVLGAFLHLLIQIPVSRQLGAKFSFKLFPIHPGALEIIRLSLPRTIALAAIKINDLVNIALASLLSAGSIVAFNFAQVLIVMPVGLFGASIAQAALPTLSLEVGEGKFDEFKQTVISSLHQILFLVLPAGMILAILRIPAVRLVFGAANFPWDSTVLTGRIVIILSIGLVAQAVSLLLTRALYALKDAKTPVIINLATILINLILSITFVVVLKFSILYLAGAYAFSTVVNCLLLLYFLNAKINFDIQKLLVPIVKMFFSTIGMGVALYVPMKLLDQLVFDTTKVGHLLILTVIVVSSGSLVYLLFAYVLNIEEVKVFSSLIIKRLPLRAPKQEEVIETASPTPTTPTP